MHIPAIYAGDDRTALKVLEFFTVHIRNPNTRKAYGQVAARFSDWCMSNGLMHIEQVQSIHVATYIESLDLSPPSVKQHLSALRMLFDWLVVGQALPSNPAGSVRGPRYSVKKGKTPVLEADEARALIAAIDTGSVAGLRDRALIGLMVYTFARVGAVTGMRGEDIYVQGRRTWVRLHEKGGKRHEMPCHHNLEEYLHAYIDKAQIDTGKQFLFQTIVGRTGRLSGNPMSQSDVYRMIRRWAVHAEIRTQIGCHTFRATGITEYLRNGGQLELAQQMANHESARTTGLYDRRNDQVSLDEVERILI